MKLLYARSKQPCECEHTSKQFLSKLESVLYEFKNLM